MGVFSGNKTGFVRPVTIHPIIDCSIKMLFIPSLLYGMDCRTPSNCNGKSYEKRLVSLRYESNYVLLVNQSPLPEFTT